MNFFEQELRKVVSPRFLDATYVGRACYVPLGEGLRARLQFVTCGHADHYVALKMTVLNPKEGDVDSLLVRFADLLGKKPTNNPYFKNGILPYIWENDNTAEWYVYQPTAKDYADMSDAVSSYLGVFQSQEQTMKQSNAPSHPQPMTM